MSDGVLGRFSLRGRGALVTGAARGLGAAMALALAEAGADIVAVDVEPLDASSGRSPSAASAARRGRWTSGASSPTPQPS